MAESSILYAAPGATGTCALSQPCSAATAIVHAVNATPTPIVRLLPGTYTTPLHVDVATATPLMIVGTSATLAIVGSGAAIVVDAGAAVRIRNLTSTSERQVQCGLASSSAPISSVALEGATLTMVGAGLAFETQRCVLDLANVDLTTNVDVIGTRDDSTLSADQLYVHGNAINAIIGAGARVNIEITNSVLENTQVLTFFNDAGPPGSSMRFAYTTLDLPNELGMCTGTTAPYRAVTFENSILATQGTRDAFVDPINPANCAFAGTILARQPTPPAGAMVANPGFVNRAAGDFHLQSSSPAVDAAVPATANPDHDLDGNLRPQGGAADIGAFELAQ